MRRLPLPAFPRAIRYAGVLAVAALIAHFSFTGVPPQAPNTDPWWDKKLHFAAYAALGLAVVYATIDDDRPLVRIGLIVGIATAYGAGIELVQWTLPNRYFGVGDLIANAVGALLATSWLLFERTVDYVSVPT